jgi:replicative DNA helicase
METTEQLPPHNLEAEKLLLGGLLCDQKEWDLCAMTVSADDFYDLQHQDLWRGMMIAAAEATPFPLIEVEDLSYMVTLKVNAPVGTGLTRYAKVVKEEANKRRVYEMAQEAQKQARNGKPVMELVNTLSDELAQIGASEPSEAISMDKAMGLAVSHIDAIRSGERAHIGRSTGYEGLDHYLGGLAAGGLYLIAARPSIGKTALGLSIALRTAAMDDKPVYLASLEMSREELSLRLLSQHSFVGLAKIRTGRQARNDSYGEYDYLTEGNYIRLAEAAKEVASLPIIIDDSAHVSPSSLRSQIKRHDTKNKLGLVIIDYVQLMTGDRKRMDDYERVSEASRQLKLLAKEFSVPVVALSQLNRECEKRPGKRPQLSDLRESGNLEQDADAVMFIYRPGYYGMEAPTNGFTEIIIAKQRNGPIGSVTLEWEAEMARFS